MTKEDIAALKRGERSAQRDFIAQYADGVFDFIARMVSNAQDAEELAQDTLIKALRHIDTYDPQHSSLHTWLRRIAYRTALNHFRRPAPLMVAFEQLSTHDLSMINAADEALEQALQAPDDTMTDYLRRALDYLPPDELALVNLFYFDDLPLKDIAFIVERPPGTLATRLHRIRKKLFSIILKLQKR